MFPRKSLFTMDNNYTFNWFSIFCETSFSILLFQVWVALDTSPLMADRVSWSCLSTTTGKQKNISISIFTKSIISAASALMNVKLK